MTLKEKKAAIAKFKTQMKKDFGQKSILDGKEIPRTEFFSTGIPSIDYALSGGIAKGRMFSIYGEFSSGKSTLLAQMIKYNQDIDPNFTCMYIDQEQKSFTPEYLEKLGLDMDRFDYIPKNDGETIFEIIRRAVGMYDIIVLDSTNAMYPRERADVKKEVGTNNEMAGAARLLSKYIPTINLIAEDGSKTSLIFVEQTRATMDQYHPLAIGVGNAVGFYVSQRLMLKKGKLINEGDKQVGNGVRFQVMKSSVGVPLIKGETGFVFGKGFDPQTDKEVFVEKIFTEKLGDDLDHLFNSPHFKQISKMKLQYITEKGEVIDISSKGKIKEVLREKGLIDEAFKYATEMALENSKTASAAQDEYGITDAAGEYIGEIKDEPVV